MKQTLIWIIQQYQHYMSPDTGVFKSGSRKTCVFYPTCSQYTIDAIDKYGSIKGVWLGCRRVVRCHPWQKEHIDPLK